MKKTSFSNIQFPDLKELLLWVGGYEQELSSLSLQGTGVDIILRKTSSTNHHPASTRCRGHDGWKPHLKAPRWPKNLIADDKSHCLTPECDGGHSLTVKHLWRRQIPPLDCVTTASLALDEVEVGSISECGLEDSLHVRRVRQPRQPVESVWKRPSPERSLGS